MSRISDLNNEEKKMTPHRKKFIIPLNFILSAVIIILFHIIAFSPSGFVDYHQYGKIDRTTAALSVIGQKEARLFLYFFLFGSILIILLVKAFRQMRLEAKLKACVEFAVRRKKITIPALFLAATGLIALMNLTSYGQTPLTDDEWVYRFQAQVLASGSLTAELHGPPGFFKNQFLVVTDKIYSQYAFGHPALLAAGYLLGIEHFLPCLAGGAAVIFIFLTAGLVSGPRRGLLAALFILFSPQFVFTQGGHSSQVTIIMILAAFLFFFFYALKNYSSIAAIAGGMLCGWGLQTRPIDTLVICVPLLIILVSHFIRHRQKDFFRTIGFMALGSIITGGLYLLTNWIVNGGPFTTNYNPLWKDHESGADFAFGFGLYPWGLVHTPVKGLKNMAVNFIRMNFWMFGWPVSWLPAAAGVFLVKKLKNKVFGIMIAGAFTVYFFYFWPGTADTGPVYYYFLLVPAALLAAAGLEIIAKKASKRKITNILGDPLSLWLAATIASWTLFVPLQTAALKLTAQKIEAPYNYLEQNVKKPALVFTPFYFYVAPGADNNSILDLPSAVLSLRNNKPDLSDEILLVRDLKIRNRQLIKRFPKRHPYRFYRLGPGQYFLQPLVQPR